MWRRCPRSPRGGVAKAWLARLKAMVLDQFEPKPYGRARERVLLAYAATTLPGVWVASRGQNIISIAYPRRRSAQRQTATVLQT
eukprot:9503831-Pyramimonas_sp.AAC.2